jgi:hypothetical protein
MHGGHGNFCDAGLAFMERSKRQPAGVRPSFVLAVVVHWLTIVPVAEDVDAGRHRRDSATSLPGVLRSEKAVGDWLGHGFDADTEMLESSTRPIFRLAGRPISAR